MMPIDVLSQKTDLQKLNVRLLFAALSLALAPVAAAQPAKSPLSALFGCQEISDDTARLACLDREVAALYGEAESDNIIAVDREQFEEASYGFDLPSKPGGTHESEALAPAEAAGGRVVRDEDNRIKGIESLAVARISETPYGKLVVELQNGQIWRQIDDTHVSVSRGTPHDEMTVSIRNAALGSYKMQLNGENRWFRARREY